MPSVVGEVTKGAVFDYIVAGDAIDIENTTPDVTPDGTVDHLLTHDADADANKRVLLNHVPGAVVTDTEPTSPATGLMWYDTTSPAAGGGIVWAITIITANTTLTASFAVVLVNAAAGAIIVTVPLASAHAGRMYYVKKIDSSANTVTVKSTGTDTIELDTEAVLTVQGEDVPFVSDGISDWGIL